MKYINLYDFLQFTISIFKKCRVRTNVIYNSNKDSKNVNVFYEIIFKVNILS